MSKARRLLLLSVFGLAAIQPTPGHAATRTFVPSRDLYVVVSKPGARYAGGHSLRVDGTPVTRSIIRFHLRLGGERVTRATLYLYVRRGSRAGFVVRAAHSRRTIGRSGRIRRGRWARLSVDPAVLRDASLGLVLSTKSRRGVILCSRECRRQPRLVVETLPKGAEPAKRRKQPAPAVQSPQCSDGQDNDADALIDFPADPGCTDALDNDETDPAPAPPPPPPPPPPGVFVGDWESGSSDPWTMVQAKSVADQFAVVTSGVRQGKYAARFTVRPGDQFLSTSGERCEVSWTGEREGPGSDKWYAWSTFFPTDWVSPSWAVFTQWHSSFPVEPPLGFYVYQDQILVNARTGTFDAAGQPSYRKTFVLLNPFRKGVWNDFLVHIRWSLTAGSMEVWHRASRDAPFTQVMSSGPIPTLQEQGGVTSMNYLKHGLYRSSGSSFTNTLYQDGFRRGNTEADVLPAFG